eukprot:GFUD01046824.1.p1 GENE.GFUD01046824.1~~GFUD01046824.1.p1  ORF type:complete len:139 (+),score=36.70 GFUD01046824.1:52-417(+)
MSSSVFSNSSFGSVGEEGRGTSTFSSKPAMNFNSSFGGLTQRQKTAGYASLWQQARPESEFRCSSSSTIFNPESFLEFPTCQIKYHTLDEVTINTEEGREEEMGERRKVMRLQLQFNTTQQ